MFFKKRQQIWKLQRPVFTNDNYNNIMAYTEDRQNNAMIVVDADTIKEVFGDEYKVYVLAHVKDGNLQIGEQVDEQEW